MSHDERDVETVAEALHRANGYLTPMGSYLPIYRTGARELARAVLDALDLPGRERRAKAEALREAASAIELPSLAWDDGTPSVEQENAESAAEAWLRARAAELDPEGADDE